MTTNPTPIPEPTPLTTVATGKRDGETVVATRMDGGKIPWLLRGERGFRLWCSWNTLSDELTDIRVVDVAEVVARPTKVAGCARCDRIEAHALGIEGLLGRRRDQLTKAREEIDQLKARIDELEATKPEPGPWLRGDELEAVMSTLKAGDVVEVDCRGYTATGKLWAHSPSGLSLWSSIVRTSDGNPGPYIDALRIIERAPEPEPEPGADIRNEVVEAALAAIPWASDHQLADVRAALAAADAKRAELAGGVA